VDILFCVVDMTSDFTRYIAVCHDPLVVLQPLLELSVAVFLLLSRYRHDEAVHKVVDEGCATINTTLRT
jgi:hypothetical protein